LSLAGMERQHAAAHHGDTPACRKVAASDEQRARGTVAARPNLVSACVSDRTRFDDQRSDARTRSRESVVLLECPWPSGPDHRLFGERRLTRLWNSTSPVPDTDQLPMTQARLRTSMHFATDLGPPRPDAGTPPGRGDRPPPMFSRPAGRPGLATS
jgi:hypothetical protein